MIVHCLFFGSLAGIVAALTGVALGADWLTCALLYCAAGYPVAVILMLIGSRRDRDAEQEAREVEADLIAWREARLQAERQAAAARDGLHPVLFRALRLQEQTSLRGHRAVFRA